MVFGKFGILNAFRMYILNCRVIFLHDSIKMEDHLYSSLADEIVTSHMRAHSRHSLLPQRFRQSHD